ncbi:MAG: TonB-dependent receptor [Hahellaceae bacterium]|nr:TonB-dependent receptor [Hahellaceae bacterium]
MSTYASLSFAAGYTLNEQSASSMGTANAGAAANTENASVMYFNPAGIAFLQGTQLSGGVTFLDVSNTFSGTATNTIGQPVAGSPGGDYVAPSVIPNFYVSTQLNDTLSAGIGLFAPFGVAGDYDADFSGRYFADETELKALSLQPTLAYKILPAWSLGLGVMVTYAEGTLTKAQDYSALTVTSGIPAALIKEGHFDVSGDDIAVGWNIGLMFQPDADTSIGLNYRSKMNIELTGNATLTQVPVATGSNPPIAYVSLTEKASVPLTTPESVTLSIKQRLSQDWTLLAGTTWTRWSQFENLDILSDEVSGSGRISAISGPKYGAAGYIGHVPEQWHNTWSWSVGTAYDLNESITLKAGYAFDQSPIQNAYRTARVPSADRNWLTLGLQYRVQDWTLDAATGYLFIDDVKVNEHDYKVDGSKIGKSSLTANYELEAFGLALQISKRF